MSSSGMKREQKDPIDFLKVIEGIRAEEKAQLKEACKQMRLLYLELLDAGFNMIEAMAFIAALFRPSETKNDQT